MANKKVKKICVSNLLSTKDKNRYCRELGKDWYYDRTNRNSNCGFGGYEEIVCYGDPYKITRDTDGENKPICTNISTTESSKDKICKEVLGNYWHYDSTNLSDKSSCFNPFEHRITCYNSLRDTKKDNSPICAETIVSDNDKACHQALGNNWYYENSRNEPSCGNLRRITCRYDPDRNNNSENINEDNTLRNVDHNNNPICVDGLSSNNSRNIKCRESLGEGWYSDSISSSSFCSAYSQDQLTCRYDPDRRMEPFITTILESNNNNNNMVWMLLVSIIIIICVCIIFLFNQR